MSEGFLKKFYNAVRGAVGGERIYTIDEVSKMYGPAETLGAPEEVRVAMDSMLESSGVYTLIQHACQLGQAPLTQFVGYGVLQSLTQNGLIRACIETVADDMTRGGIELKKDNANPDLDDDGEISEEEKERQAEEDRENDTLIAEMNATIRKYKLLDVLHEAYDICGYEGGSMIYIDTGAIGEELKTPLNVSPYSGEIKMGDLKRFTVVDPVNIFPGVYNSIDPLREDYFVPETYWILGQEVHKSRLIPIIENPVPILLKPSYNFMGVARAQILWDYVLHFQQCRVASADLVTKHSTTVFKTQMGEILFSNEGRQNLDTRIKFFKENRDNLNIVAIDKENEDIVNVDAPVTGVDTICKQALEYLAAINRTPAVKLLGISPSGFNATGESDIRNYYDHIRSMQEKVFRDAVKRCLDVLQLNLNGKIDKGLTFEFSPLSDEDKNALVTYQKTKVDVIGALLDYQIISGEEARKALAADPDSGFTDLDPDEVPEDEGAEGEGGAPGMPPGMMGGEEEEQPEKGAEEPPVENHLQNQPEQVDKTEDRDKMVASDGADLPLTDDDMWITVHPHGGGSRDRRGDRDGEGGGGVHVLLDDEGNVKAGMGGKFNGKHISEVGKGKKKEPSKPKALPKPGLEVKAKSLEKKEAEAIKKLEEASQSDNYMDNFLNLIKIQGEKKAVENEIKKPEKLTASALAGMTLPQLKGKSDQIKDQIHKLGGDWLSHKIKTDEYEKITNPLKKDLAKIEEEIHKKETTFDFTQKSLNELEQLKKDTEKESNQLDKDFASKKIQADEFLHQKNILLAKKNAINKEIDAQNKTTVNAPLQLTASGKLMDTELEGMPIAELEALKKANKEKFQKSMDDFFNKKISHEEYKNAMAAHKHNAALLDQKIKEQQQSILTDPLNAASLAEFNIEGKSKAELEQMKAEIDQKLSNLWNNNGNMGWKDYQDQEDLLNGQMKKVKKGLKLIRNKEYTAKSEATQAEWRKQFSKDKANPITPADPRALTKDEIKNSLPAKWGEIHAEEFVDNVRDYTRPQGKSTYQKVKYDPVVDYGIRNSSAKWDQGVIFRGEGVDPEDFAKYKVGGKFTIPGLSSWTKKQSETDNFKDHHGEVPCVYIDRTEGKRNAMSVENISAIPSEREVIYAMNSEFKILSMKEENGVNYIEVKAVRRKSKKQNSE